jgi:cytoskeletal protein CcmA (bactofilin family)
MDTSDTGISTSSRGRGRRGAAAPAVSAPGVVVLGPRDSLIGTLTVDGDVRIEGTLEGEVSATGEVSVQPAGTARARIVARDIIIRGNVDGSAIAVELVAIGDSATFSGEAHASRLRIDEGATVNATIAMSGAGDAPRAHGSDAHDDEASVDVTGSAVSGEGDHGAYADVSAGSESDAYSDERTAETTAVSSGSDSEVG